MCIRNINIFILAPLINLMHPLKKTLIVYEGHEWHLFFTMICHDLSDVASPDRSDSPLTMNSWPSILESPFGFCRRPIQWCISSGVSVLQWITRLAVMITNEFGLRKRNRMSTAQTSIT